MTRHRLSPAPALVLFDIDGTLLRRSGPHHRQALVDAVRAVTGLETSTDHIPVHGMLDPDILAWMLRDGGVVPSRIRRLLPAIMKKAESLYVRRVPDLRAKTCPGVRMLLSRLRRRAIPAALVTGNLPRIGWKKMERAALRHHFAYGAFAGEARDRAALAGQAIRRARRERLISSGARVSLIGDAPSDILAAKANGAQAIAVRTGISTLEELAAAGPDLLLEDLTALPFEVLLEAPGGKKSAGRRDQS
jgi:phosphoglycolate phosphatase-like HAD superfamily hydrolase